MIKNFQQYSKQSELYNESLRDHMVGISPKEIKEKIKDLDMESQLLFLKKNKVTPDTLFTDEDFEKFIEDYITSYGYNDINHNYSITKYNLPKKYYKIPTTKKEIEDAYSEVGFADFIEYMSDLGVNLMNELLDYLDYDKVFKKIKETNDN